LLTGAIWDIGAVFAGFLDDIGLDTRPLRQQGA
jgi:hypothetical protein